MSHGAAVSFRPFTLLEHSCCNKTKVVLPQDGRAPCTANCRTAGVRPRRGRRKRRTPSRQKGRRSQRDEVWADESGVDAMLQLLGGGNYSAHPPNSGAVRSPLERGGTEQDDAVPPPTVNEPPVVPPPTNVDGGTTAGSSTVGGGTTGGAAAAKKYGIDGQWWLPDGGTQDMGRSASRPGVGNARE